MNSARVNDWLTLIANMAVVVGIVFLLDHSSGPGRKW